MASMSRHRGSSFLAVVCWVVRLSDPFLLRIVNRSGNCCSSPAFFSLVELSTCVFGPWHLALLTLGNTGLSGFRSPLATARVVWAARGTVELRGDRAEGSATWALSCPTNLASSVSVGASQDQVCQLPLSLFACSACGSFDVSIFLPCSVSLVMTGRV